MARSAAGDGLDPPPAFEVILLDPDGADPVVDHGTAAAEAGLEDLINGGSTRSRRVQVAPRLIRPRRSAPAAISRPADALIRRWQAQPPRRRRLISIVGLAMVLIGAGTAITVTRPTGSATTEPRPSSSYDPNADTSSALGSPVAVDGGDVVGVAVGTGTVYVASRDRLSVVDTSSHKVVRSAGVTSTTDARILADPTANTVWDVDLGTWPAQVREFARDSLRLTRSVSVAGIVWDAVVLDGRLYLATATGIAVIAPGATTLTPVTATDPTAEALTVDPTSHAVLALAPGSNGRIVTISNDGNTIQAGSALNVSSPTIAKVGPSLWAGGINPDARLLRIDEKTLRPLPESAGGETVAEGATNELQAIAGSTDLWIYSRNDQRLYCADGQTGEILQIWNGITQSVAPGGRDPYVVTNGQARPLVLRGRCTG